MAMIQNDWLDVLKPEFSKPYYRQLFQFVQGGGLSSGRRYF